ncbi:MAG: putative transport protein [Paraglaciecola sp.]|jgi:predicted transport protein
MASQEQMLQTMYANLKEKTGKTLAEWLVITAPSTMQKHGEFMKWLKADQGVTHGFANLIALETLKIRKGENSEIDLVAAQYAGSKASLQPIYEQLVKAIQQFGSDVELAPKKAYVSIRRKKQFALIQPSTKTRVDVGINLKDFESQGNLEKSGSFNAMVSHRVRLETIEDINDDLLQWLQTAYQQAG